MEIILKMNPCLTVNLFVLEQSEKDLGFIESVIILGFIISYGRYFRESILYLPRNES